MGESNSLKKNTMFGFMWRFAERCGAQGVAFIVSIVLARILEPETYGLIALVTVFTNILSVFVDSGMGEALVQKKDADDLDFSTVFYFNIVMCVAIYAILFFCAPFISEFYKNPDLTPVVRVLSITILISGVKSIQQAYVSRNMMFKRFFFSTLGGTLFSAGVGIFLAAKGAGVWALVVQQLANLTIDTLILWITVKWRPKAMFSFERLKGLFSFGWKILVSRLIDTAYGQIRSLIIGKIYSSADLAFYNKGKNFPNLIISNVNSSIDSVLLPSMAQAQDDPAMVKHMTRRSIKTSTYIMAPLLMGLAACSKPLISLILTEKWLECVPYMIIFCITFMFYPVHTANLNAIKSMGRSDLFLKLEIIKKIVGIAAILITMRISVMAMAYSLLVISVLSQIINSWPNKKLMNYSYLEQLKDILPGIFLAVFMGLCVWTVTFLHLPNPVTLIIQVPLGGVIFIGLSALFKLESFTYCFNMIKPYLNKILHRKREH